TVEVLSTTGELILTVDGQDGADLRPQDRLVVRRGKATVPLVRFASPSFFNTLRRKLHWGLEHERGSRGCTTHGAARRTLHVATRMLIEPRILNFAVIESLSLRLEAGVNALTGETGAGKSIIVGALSLLLGERASADVVRAGAERASVEGVFDVSRHPAVVSALAEQGIDTEDGLLIL